MLPQPYDAAFAPAPFGLGNTGVICHFNTLLQGLASCPALIKAVLNNADYMARTATGKALHTFISAIATREGARENPSVGIEASSARVMEAFVSDLRARRPWFKFGAGQECADEGLVLLLDMIEPADDEDEKTAGEKKAGNHPISRLFLHRYVCESHCKECKVVTVPDKGSRSATDLAVQFSVGHLELRKNKPTSVLEFSTALRRRVDEVAGYLCPACKKKTTILRLYRLAMVPEIIVCLFGIYKAPRPMRYIPPRLMLAGVKPGEYLTFRQVATAEQTGNADHRGVIQSGHYTARGLRRGGIYAFNDASTPHPSSLPSPPSGTPGNENKYLVFYNYQGVTTQDDAAKDADEKTTAPPPKLAVKVAAMPRTTESGKEPGEPDEVSEMISQLRISARTADQPQ